MIDNLVHLKGEITNFRKTLLLIITSKTNLYASPQKKHIDALPKTLKCSCNSLVTSGCILTF